MFISSVTYAVVGFGKAGCPHPKGTRRLPKISLRDLRGGGVWGGFASPRSSFRAHCGG
jgi:hypothetical protein